ncbi:phosphatidylinositol-glycan biosynthesis class X protein [Aulostomus maculatus]
MYFALFFVLACFFTCLCSIEKGVNNCGSLRLWLQSTSLSVEINNKGFHREAVTTVELSPDVLSGVRVLLVYRWPRGIFVDPYQLAVLSKQILLDSTIDLEVPAHKTSGFVTYVYPALGERTSKPLKVTIPIHGRYHEPSFDEESFASVDLQPPELLLWTDTCAQLNNLETHTVVEAPCTADNSSTCPWVKVQPQKVHGHMTVQFPVGDGFLVAPVCGVTLLVTVVCCATLSKVMWKHRIV